MKSIAALILWSVALGVGAQPAPGGPPHAPGAPSPEALATIPNLSAAQQVELRRILIERRDAHDMQAAKTRGEREALARKDRGEHERIDEQSAERLRKLLGDDGYKAFAEWQMAHRGPPHGPAPGPGMGPGGPRHGPRGPGDKVAFGPPGADDDE